LAILAHDFAKPHTTHRVIKAGRERIVSPGHEEAGGPIAATFLERIGTPKEIVARVVPLVENHLAHMRPHTDRSVRRLSRKLMPESMHGLCLIMTADHCGRPPLPKVAPAGVHALRQKAAELAVASAPPTPILKGRHLMELGMKPGEEMGVILGAAFEAQLDGAFSTVEGGVAWLQTYHPTGGNAQPRGQEA
jgi:tRNA nucleotidyltransferase (CCA-adding enzyme)